MSVLVSVRFGIGCYCVRCSAEPDVREVHEQWLFAMRCMIVRSYAPVLKGIRNPMLYPFELRALANVFISQFTSIGCSKGVQNLCPLPKR